MREWREPMKNHACRAVGMVAVVVAMLLLSSAHAAINIVGNANGDPANVFECTLTAVEQDVIIVTNVGATLVTNTVHAMSYKDENACCWPQGPGIPVPLIMLRPGQMVICHFKNTLPIGDVPDGA